MITVDDADIHTLVVVIVWILLIAIFQAHASPNYGERLTQSLKRQRLQLLAMNTNKVSSMTVLQGAALCISVKHAHSSILPMLQSMVCSM